MVDDDRRQDEAVQDENPVVAHRILLAILRLRDDAYGVTIRAELADRTGRTVAPGALYSALERLETVEIVLKAAPLERGRIRLVGTPT